MAATKRALWGALEIGPHRRVPAGAHELVAMWGHPDQEEGPRAFAEKREPPAGSHSNRARAVTDVAVGTAVIAYIEPHAGQAQAFNRWYERDHFYAATTAGPGAFVGRALGRDPRVQGGRPPAATWFGDPRRAVVTSRRCGCSTTRRTGAGRRSRRWQIERSSKRAQTACFKGHEHHLHTRSIDFTANIKARTGDGVSRRPRSIIRAGGLQHDRRSRPGERHRDRPKQCRRTGSARQAVGFRREHVILRDQGVPACARHWC